MSDFIAAADRLVIRKMEDSDQGLIYALVQELPLIAGFSENEEYMELYRQSYWDETNSPDICNGMIFLKDSGVFIGKICMQYIDRDFPELGIDILKSFRNHGYGPEAIVAFCNWYSEAYGLPMAKVRISKDNTHSVHVFEKLGAEYEKATSYLSEEMLNMLREELPDEDLSVFSQNSIRDYRLRLPISAGE